MAISFTRNISRNRSISFQKAKKRGAWTLVVEGEQVES
jgi:hypothetical protein